jgi:hypothetical protein
MVNKKNEENKIKYTCPLCLKEFGNKKDNYQSHLNKTGCGLGITKLEEMKIENEEMKKQNEKKDIDILRLKEKNDKLVDEEKKLKDKNDKLKEEIENLKKQAIIYTDNSTNITNNFILQINNFDDTKCEVVIQNLLKYIGKSIYLKTVEDIYLNNAANHNIYVADKNRQIVKIWNNGIWQSKNMIIIDKIIDNIVKQFNLSISEIKKDNDKYERLKKKISTKLNYIHYCDTDYIEDLEDEPLDNKEQIQRCKDFRDLVFDEIKTLLHDNKGKVLDTHKQIKQTKTKINIKA